MAFAAHPAQHAQRTKHVTPPVLSPSRLATETGMSKGFVSKVLAGHKGITLAGAAALATAAGITLDQLHRHITARATV